MPLTVTWMDPEIIILSEVRQRQILLDITYMWNLKNNTNESIYKKQKQTHRCRKQTYGYQKGEGGKDKLGVWD